MSEFNFYMSSELAELLLVGEGAPKLSWFDEFPYEELVEIALEGGRDSTAVADFICEASGPEYTNVADAIRALEKDKRELILERVIRGFQDRYHTFEDLVDAISLVLGFEFKPVDQEDNGAS